MKHNKRFLSFIIVITLMICVSSVIASANTGIWPISGGQYGGDYLGASSTTVKYVGGTLTRVVDAETRTIQAVPNAYVGIIARYNGSIVYSYGITEQDVTSVSISPTLEAYTNVTVTGTGYHEIWSASLTRQYNQTQY